MAQDRDQKQLESLSRDDHHHQQDNSNARQAFTIATPAVTTILPMSESMSDTSFMLQTTSFGLDNINNKDLNQQVDIDNKPAVEQNNQKTTSDDINLTNDLVPNNQSSSTFTNLESKQKQQVDDIINAKLCKKRNKIPKKNAKLDAKSKLEKSRQSARECRARKKLRYQYLEDLVSNREKAVVKLREELNMFCQLSKQIDIGTISENDKKLLIDQTKENNKKE